MNPCWSPEAQVHSAGAGIKTPAPAFCIRCGQWDTVHACDRMRSTREVVSEIVLQTDINRTSSDVALPLDTFDNRATASAWAKKHQDKNFRLVLDDMRLQNLLYEHNGRLGEASQPIVRLGQGLTNSDENPTCEDRCIISHCQFPSCWLLRI